VLPLLLAAIAQAQTPRIGDPGWAFDESRLDPRFPVMREWALAGVEGGIPLRGSLPVKWKLMPGEDLQNAINTVAAQGGGVIELKQGDHRISNTVQLKSNIVLRGESKERTVLQITIKAPFFKKAGGSPATAIEVNDAQWVGLEDLTIRYGPVHFEPYDKDDFHAAWDRRVFHEEETRDNELFVNSVIFSRSSNCWVDNCNILCAGAHPLGLSQCRHMTMRDNLVDRAYIKKDSMHGGYYGVWGSSHCLFYNERVRRIRHFALMLPGCKYNVVYGCDFEVDVNFHDKDDGYNLVEKNRIATPVWHSWDAIGIGASGKHRPPGSDNWLYDNEAISKGVPGYNRRGPTSEKGKLYRVTDTFGKAVVITSDEAPPIGGTLYALIHNSSQHRTVRLSDDVEFKFAWVVPGRFVRGSPVDEPNRDSDEGPQQQIHLTRGFYLGLHEVTQRQWHAVMQENPSVFRQPVEGEDPLDRPVESVSWNATQRFIERLNSMGLGRFRLPTEAEWEYAARAGTSTPFPWSGDVHLHAWANSRSLARTHPVGKKPANAWGFFDMHGNVWEWCHDWYAEYPASSEAVDPMGPLTGSERVFRGGSWYDFAPALRSANRHRHVPDVGYPAIGLRLVMESTAPRIRRITLPNGTEIQFTHIPAGEFAMGNPATEASGMNDERPVHAVAISKGFWIGTYEVTQLQWESLMGENPSVFRSPNNPVEMVSWNDAQVFLHKLNDLGFSGEFRLPTEAEWEYAARTGDDIRGRFSSHPSHRDLNTFGWFNPRSEGCSHPVGMKRPNSWGLYDMQGNVWEWCCDWYGPYAVERAIDPIGAHHGVGRVIRGGSWFNEPEALRVTNRHHHSADSRQTNIGLRVVWVTD
jgi:formylglycine-generating enzyme required for sulfatase activity